MVLDRQPGVFQTKNCMLQKGHGKLSGNARNPIFERHQSVIWRHQSQQGSDRNHECSCL